MTEFTREIRPLDCELSKAERADRSKRAHEALHEAQTMAEEIADAKAAIAVRTKGHKKKLAEAQTYSDAARTGKESRKVAVLYLIDGDGLVREKRQDTGEVLTGPRQPYAEEQEAIDRVRQQVIPGTERPMIDPSYDAPDEPQPKKQKSGAQKRRERAAKAEGGA